MRENFFDKLKRLDFLLLFFVIVLSLFGILMIASATRGGVKGISSSYFIYRQALFLIAGFLLFFVLSIVNIRKFESFSLFLYLFSLFLLVAVLFIGESRLGAQRWIDIGPISIQPSELSKVFVLLFLSSYFSKIKGRTPTFKEIVNSLILVLIPALLVFMQPDLGTAIVLLVGWMAVIFTSGARWQHILVFIAVFLIAFAGAVKFGILHDYQIKRLTVFLNPEADTTGAGYNITQAKIAIGSGGFFGKGIFSGTQSALRFVPERQTDFIFSVVGEETGFIGSLLVLLLYLIILARIIQISANLKERTGKIFSFSYAFVLLFHILVNVGMNLGIMPVTGIPLPLISYGGSFLLANMISLGIIESFWVHRKMI
ncbi:MAG: rod shape-determining protein RodA [Actinobacteria bacterium]|nr:rod shape-determining protein RodA [Actinomycetota bacterium]